MKNMTKLISAFAFLALMGSYNLKAQSCTIVLKPNAVTESNLYVDQVVQFSTAISACHATGKISQIIVKYHNSFYNSQSPAMQNLQINIGRADNSVVKLTSTQDSTVKGPVISGPAQSYTATLTYLGSNIQQYMPNDQYIEVKGFNFSGTTTANATLSNWIEEIDVILQ